MTESWECDKACTSKAKGNERGERDKMRYRRHEGMGGERRGGDEARWKERKDGVEGKRRKDKAVKRRRGARGREEGQRTLRR